MTDPGTQVLPVQKAGQVDAIVNHLNALRRQAFIPYQCFLNRLADADDAVPTLQQNPVCEDSLSSAEIRKMPAMFGE